MKHILLAFLFILTSCSSVDRYMLRAKKDSVINPEKTETIYIGRLRGDNTGEFRAVLSKLSKTTEFES